MAGFMKMHLLQRIGALAVVAGFCAVGGIPGDAAADVAVTPRETLAAEGRLATVPHDTALEDAFHQAGIARMAVQYAGQEETLATYSRIVLHDLTGRYAIHGQDPVFTVLSMTYDVKPWLGAEILPVESPWLREMMGFAPGKKWASVADCVRSANRETVSDFVDAHRKVQAEIKAKRQVRDTAVQARTVGVDGAALRDWTPEGADEATFRSLMTDADAFAAYDAELKSLERKAKEEQPNAEVASRLLDRIQMLLSLSAAFRVVPDPESYRGEWTTPWSEELKAGRVEKAAREFDTSMEAAIKTGDVKSVKPTVERFLGVVEPLERYPSRGERWARTFYVEMQPFRKTAWVYFLSVLAWVGAAATGSRKWRGAALGLLVGGFVFHTASEVLRLYLSGHMPVSNMYESITFASWGMMGVGLALTLFTRRQAFAITAGAIGFLALTLVSLMPLHETRIQPLRAVLNSYWLNIHVTSMLLSYGTFLLAGVLSGAYLVWLAVRRRRPDLGAGRPGLVAGFDSLELYAYRCVQVGWPLLTVGIFLGGVWAQTAWGRFWGWDPKETWALITWIVYTVYLHTRMVLGWRGRISAIAALVGLIAVLVTWLGVSYLPGLAGGLHSYASPTG